MTIYDHRVFLFWTSSRMGRTDASWARLDRSLSRLARRNACRDCLRAMSFSTQLWSYRKKPSFRRSLATREQRQEYDDAFYACDPAEHIAGGEFETNLPREALVGDIAAIYSEGDTHPAAIADGVANAYARIADNHFEHTARAKRIWRRACLDALTGR